MDSRSEDDEEDRGIHPLLAVLLAALFIGFVALAATKPEYRLSQRAAATAADSFGHTVAESFGGGRPYGDDFSDIQQANVVHLKYGDRVVIFEWIEGKKKVVRTWVTGGEEGVPNDPEEQRTLYLEDGTPVVCWYREIDHLSFWVRPGEGTDGALPVIVILR